MKTKVFISNVSIPIDSSRKVTKEGVTKVLLWDKENQCYYETSVQALMNHSFNLMNTRLKAYEKDMDAKYEKFVSDTNKEMEKFKSDMARMSQTMVDIAKNSGGK